jgi:diguanylate cyclase (GGDEF)-like protein
LLQKLDDKQAELERIAHYDMLTGLPNRILLYDRLGQALALAHRKKTQIGLLYMDLDGFKIINDTLGHDAGDEALREVASRLAKIVRQADTLARIGGDEFVVLLSDLGEYADADATANAVASRYIDAMKSPFLICGTQCILGISVGVALGKEESSLDSLLKAADRAMYEAKESSRDRNIAG